MTYIPKLVTPDEVRVFFTPFLSHDDVTDDFLLMQIRVVETYIKEVWNNGSMPEKDEWSSTAALLLVAARLLQTRQIAEKYAFMKSVKIGNFSFTLTQSPDSRTNVMNLEEIAHKILQARCSPRYDLKVLMT